MSDKTLQEAKEIWLHKGCMYFGLDDVYDTYAYVNYIEEASGKIYISYDRVSSHRGSMKIKDNTISVGIYEPLSRFEFYYKIMDSSKHVDVKEEIKKRINIMKSKSFILNNL